ncbi:magnesium-translocating P-type ATPase [Ligilactobacillus acidipiscis]|uniref:magnesium-translocating P-type ATPase n=1 Tax=Ligilactobacillus acidipiscis TaxID=89059 RepID=UPI0022E33487|nr:magnesium-translocating P-type ATPase [Ligilactobacillus acidipiscis]
MFAVKFNSTRRKQTEKRALNKNNATTKIKTWAFMSKKDLLTSLSVDQTGLTDKDAQKGSEKYGPNRITTGETDTVLHRLLEALFAPFNLILLVIATITYFTDVVVSAKADYLTVIIILVLVFLSSSVSFVQQQKSSKAVETLSKEISNRADVIRNGKVVSISTEKIVPGDIVQLAAGDMIPADIRFLKTQDTFVMQSALTGESDPVEKLSDIPNNKDDALTDLTDIGFMGSNMVSGSAMAVVLSTGDKTYFGSMAENLSGDKAKTSFERGVDSVSHLLIRMMLLMLPIVFVINGLTKGEWGNSLLFAISVAVGLTPEMLPVIMASTLAKGAVSMSKHQTIVRTLDVIQTFGEMDILCTDKTGTLTEDMVSLEKYMDLFGNEDPHVLKYAYLNSSFQTGLKNLIDLAIIEHAAEVNSHEISKAYQCVDEIPFDFSRRRMSVVLEDKKGQRQLVTKGAVEEMLAISSYVEIDGKVQPFNAGLRKLALSTYKNFNSQGLRMLGVARKKGVPDNDTFSEADEKDVVLLGFVGFLDPPKKSASSAIKALKKHGVRTVVLTGDSEGVAANVCGKVGVNNAQLLTGQDVDKMDERRLAQAVEKCDVFAKLEPAQKVRVVAKLQALSHTIGYLGDGINDAPALKQADVGISVDSAVDIAKETADIVLLKKDLLVLEKGVVEGRQIFGNIIKYIKMATSGNFGNVISVIFASIFIPFLPMLPVQILTQNLLCDFAQMGIPFDNVDDEYIQKPQKWDTRSIKRFMWYLGPLSSFFDVICFAVMWWTVGANTTDLAPIFQCGWFVFGTVSQILIIYMIRTAKIPFVHSNPTKPLLFSSLSIIFIALVVGFSDLAIGLDMQALPLSFLPWLLLMLLGYCLAVQAIKKVYIGRYQTWL